MCDPVVGGAIIVGGGILSAQGHFQAANAERQAGQYNAAVMRRNAQYGRLAAAQARYRGSERESRIRERSFRVLGQANVAMAAGNVEAGVGSGLDIQLGIVQESELDVQTALNNASMEAWGYEVQAQGMEEGAAYTLWAAQQRAKQEELAALGSMFGAGGSSIPAFSGGG